MNQTLLNAKYNKNDQFYTQLYDIYRECRKYSRHFQNKTIYCNCDNPYQSNFTKFFIDNFKKYKIKRLICTSYQTADVKFKDAYLLDTTTPTGYLNKIKPLRGNGDYKSEECIEYLREADIVITNCPFSELKDFIPFLMKHNKKFLIIGNKNAVMYKEVFQYFKNNEIWFGNNRVQWFDTPSGEVKHFGNIGWITNLSIEEKPFLNLTQKYDGNIHRKADNYPVINVNKVKEIPKDYNGIMAVPLSVMDKFNHNQFELIGVTSSSRDLAYGLTGNTTRLKVDGKYKFARVLVKLKAMENQF